MFKFINKIERSKKMRKCYIRLPVISVIITAAILFLANFSMAYELPPEEKLKKQIPEAKYVQCVKVDYILGKFKKQSNLYVIYYCGKKAGGDKTCGDLILQILEEDGKFILLNPDMGSWKSFSLD